MTQAILSLLPKPEIIFYFACLLMAFILFVSGKMPSVHAWTDFMNALNTKGGNIFVLIIFTFWSLSMSVKFLYYAVNLVQSGKLTPDNALLTFGETMLFGTITGTFMGALVKTMSGETGTAPAKPPVVNSDVPAPTPAPNPQAGGQ